MINGNNLDSENWFQTGDHAEDELITTFLAHISDTRMAITDRKP